MPDFNVTALDIGILLLYIIGVRVALGWYVSRKNRGAGSEQYFLAGRNLTWPLIGLSFYVSNISGSSFIGFPAAAYVNGVQVFLNELLPALFLIFFAATMLPFYLNARVFTAPQFLETRFGKSSRLAFSGVLLFFHIFLDAAAALYAGAILMQVLYPGIPLWWTVVAIAVIAAGYVFFGGLEAVVLNDTLQAGLIYIGGIAIAIAAFAAVPSWEAVREANPEENFHLIQSASDSALPWPGVITGLIIIQVYVWGTNQVIIQRAFGARTLDHGQRGSIFAGLLKLPNLLILIIPGLLATVLYPSIQNPDLVFPTLVFDLLPIGVRGLMLAAIAAAILSSLEAVLNSASTLFTMDFVRGLRPQTADRTLVRIGQLTTISVMIIAAIWAPQIATFQTLWTYLLSLTAYIVGPVVAVFLGGMFWRRATSQGAFLTLVIGVPLGLLGFILVQVAGVINIQFLYACFILFLISCVLLDVVSLLTPAPSEEQVEGHTWKRGFLREENQRLKSLPWYQDSRYYAIVLIVVAAALLIWWW